MTTFTSRVLGEIADEVVGDIRTGPFGSQLHQSDYQATGTPVVMPQDIIDDKIVTNDIARIGEEDVERLSQHQLQLGDIIYARRGDIGRKALITERERGWMCGTGCIRISLGNDNGIVAPLFLFYYLGQPRLIEWIYNQAIGATMPNLNTSIIRDIPIEYPPLSTQRRIAHVLSAYDDLIEINQQRIDALEAAAQALYREWFVGMRFPGWQGAEWKDSPLGEIPVGWEAGQVGDIVEIERRSIKPADFEDELFAYYSFSACDENKLPEFQYGSEIKSNKYGVPIGSILLTKLNPRIPRVWMPTLHTANRPITSTEFLPLVPDSPIKKEYLFGLCSSDGFLATYAGLASGTSTSHQRVKPDALLEMTIVIPPENLIRNYSEKVNPLHKLAHSLRLRDLDLRETRDLLLPRLISGEVSVEGLPLPEEVAQ